MTTSDNRAQRDLRQCISAELVAMRGPLERKLPLLLERAEKVSFVGVCTPAGSWWNEMRDGHVFVATDRRLMLISAKFVLAQTVADQAREPEPTSIHYRDVRGVGERLGRIESKLDVDVGGTTVRLTSMRRKGAQAAADAIRRHAPVVPVDL